MMAVGICLVSLGNVNNTEAMVREKEFRLAPFSASRARGIGSLRPEEKASFAAMVSCQVDEFKRFERDCRAVRRRPPSMYAYISRCLGVVLESQPELLSVYWRRQFFVPTRIDVELKVEALDCNGHKLPVSLGLADVGARSLSDLADEITVRGRALRRNRYAPPRPHRLAPAWTPAAWKNMIGWVGAQRPQAKRRRAFARGIVQMASTTNDFGDKGGWGLRFYSSSVLSVTLGGMTKRAIVENEEIVIRECLDIAIHFDHTVTDGAPATRFMAQLVKEIESGRVLAEF